MNETKHTPTHLIAAAQEMYEVLREIVEIELKMRSTESLLKALIKAGKALAKAEGKES